MCSLFPLPPHGASDNGGQTRYPPPFPPCLLNLRNDIVCDASSLPAYVAFVKPETMSQIRSESESTTFFVLQAKNKQHDSMILRMDSAHPLWLLLLKRPETSFDS